MDEHQASFLTNPFMYIRANNDQSTCINVFNANNKTCECKYVNSCDLCQEKTAIFVWSGLLKIHSEFITADKKWLILISTRKYGKYDYEQPYIKITNISESSHDIIQMFRDSYQDKLDKNIINHLEAMLQKYGDQYDQYKYNKHNMKCVEYKDKCKEYSDKWHEYYFKLHNYMKKYAICDKERTLNFNNLTVKLFCTGGINETLAKYKRPCEYIIWLPTDVSLNDDFKLAYNNDEFTIYFTSHCQKVIEYICKYDKDNKKFNYVSNIINDMPDIILSGVDTINIYNPLEHLEYNTAFKPDINGDDIMNPVKFINDILSKTDPKISSIFTPPSCRYMSQFIHKQRIEIYKLYWQMLMNIWFNNNYLPGCSGEACIMFGGNMHVFVDEAKFTNFTEIYKHWFNIQDQ